MNVESGKPVDRDKIIFPIIYNRRIVHIGKIMKEEYLNLQTVMKKPIMARPVIAYRKKSKPQWYSSFDNYPPTLWPSNSIEFSVLFGLLSPFPNNSINIGLKTK